MKKILEIKTGSNLYGLTTPASDVDYIGVFMPNKNEIFGLKTTKEADMSIKNKLSNGKNSKYAIDRKFYEFKNFCKLASECNPNILEILFVNPENIVYIDKIGQKLINNRHIFISKLVKHKFLGYAFSQKKKMQIRTNKFNELKEAEKKLKKENPKTIMIELKNKFSKLKNNYFAVGDIQILASITVKKALKQISDRVERMSSRKELIEQWGYDTKFASHLVRLMFEGKRLLETNELIFPFPKDERQVLMDIKLGKWKMKDIINFSENLENDIEKLYDKSTLPKSSYNKVNKFVIDIMSSYVYDNYFCLK